MDDRNSTPSTDAPLLGRVRKLLAKAEATTNSHEAELFAAKAAELIARHRIDSDQLDPSPGAGELAVRQIPLGRGPYVRARLALLTAVAEPNDVRVVFQTGPTGTTALAAGFVDDLDLVEVLYTSLHQQAAAQMSEIRRPTGAATTRYRRSFLFGYAQRTGQLLAEAAQNASAESSTTTADRVALVQRERSAQVDEFAQRSFGRVVRARPAARAQASGWAAGSEAADGADVGRRRVPGRRALGRG